MRPLTKISIGLLALIAVLLLFYAKMNHDLQRILDEHPAVAACLEAGGTVQDCKDAEEVEEDDAAEPEEKLEVEGK